MGIKVFLLLVICFIAGTIADSELYPDELPQQSAYQSLDDSDDKEEMLIKSESDTPTIKDAVYTAPDFTFHLPPTAGTDEKEWHFAVGPQERAYNAVPFYEGNYRNDDSGLEKTTIAERDSYDPLYNYVIQSSTHELTDDDLSSITFLAVVIACCTAAVVVIAVIGFLSYRFQKNAKAAEDVEYPAYGVTGPNKELSPTSADRRLAQSAQMYHYQHQKQQIIAMERASTERNGSISDPDSEEENEEGDYTVYECPGLASTGEMEVKNPLFQDEATPLTPSPAQQPSGKPSDK